MNITVIGTGYVGLVTGACFAEMGNVVTCVDLDNAKVTDLKNGKIPIYEPGLDEIVVNNYKQERLFFTTSLPEAMKTADMYFIAVGTPPGADGSADLQYVLAVAREIGECMDRYCVVVDKSTVPVGTAEKVRAEIQKQLDIRKVTYDFDVVSNPEFLKEGAAVTDFMSPDRIVVGTESAKARQLMSDLYAPFTRNHPRLVFMAVRDAEMTKYAANAMLATKISFMNEIANLCEILNVDVENVRLGIGSDQRIGFHFIYPGAGYGGSCFPKDVKALIESADHSGYDATLLKSVEKRNNSQKLRLVDKVVSKFGNDLSSRTFAIWGLAFKPGTDDMREASSKVLIDGIIARGGKVKAFDPVAHESARREFDPALFNDKRIIFSDSQYECLLDADALILVTEWKPFRNPNFQLIKKLLAEPVIIDGRNQYDPELLMKEGFEYSAIGRGHF